MYLIGMPALDPVLIMVPEPRLGRVLRFQARGLVSVPVVYYSYNC